MNLYFLRHAIAADKTEWKGPDSNRPLTEEGIRKMKKVAKGIRRMDLKIDCVITSPFRRAYDTAKIVTKELKLKNKLRISKSLAADGDPKTLVRHLASSFRTWESILLVGHEPYLSRLIGMLISGSGATAIEIDKAGLAKITTESLAFSKCAVLEWLLTPKTIKKLLN